jgi:hypothetical protein
MTFVYDLPNVRNENRFVRGVANGWEWSGTYLAQSGQPVTPLSGVDSNDNGDTAGDRTVFNPAGVGLSGSVVNAVCNDGAGGATRVVTNPKTSPCAAGNTVGYVAVNPTARFIQAGVGALATTGRNTVGTPGLNIWNMSVFKTNKLTERASLQFRFQTYNTFNHRSPSVGLPTNNESIDQATNSNPLNAGYIFVTSPTFLNKFAFDGGSRTMELGLRLIW